MERSAAMPGFSGGDSRAHRLAQAGSQGACVRMGVASTYYLSRDTPNPTPPLQVLELGAGCGTLGLTVARNTPGAAEVCLTEQAYGGALQHLQLNVLANAHLPHMGSVTCCACDWTHMEPAMVQAAIAAAAGGSGSGMAATPDSSAQEQTCSSDTQKQQQAEPGGSSVVVSQQELLDLHKLVTTPWDIIIGKATAGAYCQRWGSVEQQIDSSE